METIRILLITDFALFRDVLRSVLEREEDMVIIHEASDLDSATRAARETCPDVILLDLHLSKDSGVETAAKILVENPEARIIALMGVADRDTVTRVLLAGVRGYLLKDTHMAELLQAIRCVAGGEAFIAPPVAMEVLADYRRLARQNNNGCKDDLSGRELEILHYLAIGHSNRDIAQKVFLSEQTVKNKLSEIYRKLGAENRTEAVALALRNGLISHTSQS
jgi:two-component system, NarL family, response regulator LiaR